MKSSATRTLLPIPVAALAAILSACAGGEIDIQEVYEGNVLDAEPTTFREGGKPVTGTIVRKNAEGRVLESLEYVDGFPNGTKQTWFENGQLKTEAELKFRTYGRGSGLISVGPARSYCENGTLKEERLFDAEGMPTGQHRSWTCRGELLTVSSYPAGEYRQASEMEDGTIWLIEEGTRTAEGKWEGKHTRYHQDGKPALTEHWKDGVLDGDYQEWDEQGAVKATGRFSAGNRVGIWRTVMNGWETVQDYDRNNFINLDYAGPFMQAAGIQPSTSGWAAKLPLKDYRVDIEKLRYYVSEGLVDPKKKLLIGHAPDPFVGSSWTYPYVHASREALDVLVELGADPKAKDSDNRSRLHHCIFSLGDGGVCSVAEIKRLIALGLPVDEPDVGNFTPLLDLIMTSWNWRWAPSPETQLEVARILLDAGADPDRLGGRDVLFPQKQDFSPLMAAVHAKRFELAKLLMEKSKNPGATHEAGYNLIHFVFLDQNMQRFDLRMTEDAKAFIEYAASRGVDAGGSLGELGTLKDVAQRAGAIDLARFLAAL